MKLSMAVIAVALPFCAAPVHASLELAARSKCMTCHDVGRKKMGPAFKDIAARYKGQKGAEALLADGIQKGGKGRWGRIPMPPQKVTPADAQILSKWILTL